MSIDEICKLYDIRNYTINEDGTVDVDNEVYLVSCNLTELPLKFGIVDGSFNCSNNELTTLEGSPKSVGSHFKCVNNKLTDLKGGPEKVDSYFDCERNELTTLEGGPKLTGAYFCGFNNLYDLKGCPKEVVGDFYCNNNLLTTLEDGPKSVGYFGCGYNNLTNLKGCPKEIGGMFSIESNPLADLVEVPEKMDKSLVCKNTPLGSIFHNVDLDFIKTFNTFKVIKDGVVNLKRLKYVMELFDRAIFLDDIKKHYKVK